MISQIFSHYQPGPVLESLQAKSPGVASEVLRRRMHQGQHQDQDPLLLDLLSRPTFYRLGGGLLHQGPLVVGSFTADNHACSLKLDNCTFILGGEKFELHGVVPQYIYRFLYRTGIEDLKLSNQEYARVPI